MVPFTTPVQCQSPRAHLVYARTPPSVQKIWRQMRDYCDYYSKWNLWRPILKFQEMTQQHWLSLLYACVDPNELHREPSDFSPARQSASHECYFLTVAQLLMVDACGDIETMMDPLRNEAITQGSPSEIVQKSQKYGRKQDSSLLATTSSTLRTHVAIHLTAWSLGAKACRLPWNQEVSLSIGFPLKISIISPRVWQVWFLK